jgi:2-iminobutanoate/2-iminopropanoate deaminase
MKKIIPFLGKFPLSHAIIHNQPYIMEISGLIGYNTETQTMEEGIEAQTKYIMESIKTTLEQQGWSLEDLIKVRIFLTDMSMYAQMNEVYASYFPNENYPTRFAIAVL